MAKAKHAPESEILRRIAVRLVREEERERFDQALEQEHYRHSARLGGQALRYIAELDGEWIALITFSAPALNLKAREKWIKWSPRQRARRLCFIINNSRFLVRLSRERYPNVASKVMALCLKRVNRDWQEHWAHPVLLVESFVDESKYRGTCYRACGFEGVGLTAGYERSSRDFYTEHGQPKQLYLRELRPGAAALLRRGRLPPELAKHEEPIGGPCPLRAAALGSLLDLFKDLGDRRRGHGLKHRRPFVLACATVAMLLGAGGYQAFEDECSKLSQRQLRALGCRWNEKKRTFVPPSDSTFFRVLSRLDAAEFELAVGQWMMAQDPSVLERLAVDGKVLRGSGRTDGKPLQLLSAVTHRLRLTVAQLPIQEKSNEIPAFQPLLRKLPLQGSLITADAMHCQQETASFVTQELGADYLFGLKGNQSGILERAEKKLPQCFFSPGI
jgi:Druantia protein DruA/DDE_Tnp_1-associated/Transposase DDE domain